MRDAQQYCDVHGHHRRQRYGRHRQFVGRGEGLPDSGEHRCAHDGLLAEQQRSGAYQDLLQRDGAQNLPTELRSVPGSERVGELH